MGEKPEDRQGLTWAAPAGEPGFEPGFTVLETARIAVNSLPRGARAMVSARRGPRLALAWARAEPRPAHRRAAPAAALAVVLAGLCALLLAACGGDDPTTARARRRAPSSPAPASRAEAPPFTPEYAKLPQRIRLLGLPPTGKEKYHLHALMRIYEDGLLVPVPANVGIDLKRKVISPIHTHDATGVLHFESDKPFPHTLGDVFEVWGLTLGPGPDRLAEERRRPHAARLRQRQADHRPRDVRGQEERRDRRALRRRLAERAAEPGHDGAEGCQRGKGLAAPRRQEEGDELHPDEAARRGPGRTVSNRRRAPRPRPRRPTGCVR